MSDTIDNGFEDETIELIILVDDLDKDKLAAMHEDGLCTRFVVMSSPGNFQAWLQVAEEPITPEER